MNSVTLSFAGGKFTATVSVAANWILANVFIAGPSCPNLPMDGTKPMTGPGVFTYTKNQSPCNPGLYTATAAFQQQQQQSAQGQCLVP